MARTDGALLVLDHHAHLAHQRVQLSHVALDGLNALGALEDDGLRVLDLVSDLLLLLPGTRTRLGNGNKKAGVRVGETSSRHGVRVEAGVRVGKE